MNYYVFQSVSKQTDLIMHHLFLILYLQYDSEIGYDSHADWQIPSYYYFCVCLFLSRHQDIQDDMRNWRYAASSVLNRYTPINNYHMEPSQLASRNSAR
jgi:hypothetical protein